MVLETGALYTLVGQHLHLLHITRAQARAAPALHPSLVSERKPLYSFCAYFLKSVLSHPVLSHICCDLAKQHRRKTQSDSLTGNTLGRPITPVQIWQPSSSTGVNPISFIICNSWKFSKKYRLEPLLNVNAGFQYYNPLCLLTCGQLDERGTPCEPSHRGSSGRERLVPGPGGYCWTWSFSSITNSIN